MEKLCWKCKTVLPISKFYIQKKSKDGRQNACRQCQKIYANQWKKDNPEKAKSQKASWVKSHPEYAKGIFDRHRARKKNASVVEKINRITIFQRDKWICQLCFGKVSKKAKGEMGPSLDHVIPLSKGGNHTAQNIVLVHKKCNSQKGNRAVPQQQRLFG